LIDSLCSRAVLRPSPWSGFLLEAIEEMEPPDRPRSNTARSSVASWRQTWMAHELARRLSRVWQLAKPLDSVETTNHPPFWLDLSAGPSWLVTSRACVAGCWCVALSEDHARRIVDRVLRAQRRPAYFGVGVEVSGRTFCPTATNRAVLAAVRHPTAPVESDCPLQVSIVLTDPDQLFARQRSRTLWFGSLIALAAVAVLVGFGAAWRAFQRELRLGELKTNFVSSVSHELRAPIASVRLMAEELEDQESQAGPKLRQYHRFIIQECRRLSALIENVLDFARHEQGRAQYEFEPTDLAALVQETVRLMIAYADQKQITLTTTIVSTPLTWEVDGRAIQQVLVNLIDNAIKHSPNGSTITVGLEGPPAENPPDSALRFWVEDRGEGIPAEEHQRIFEQFYRRGTELRRETQGVGLGLAIVKYVTEAHGGTVTVRSAAGQGSRFMIALPARSGTVTEPA